MYHFDLVSKYFFQRFHFFCNTPVLFSMIFVARFLGFLQEYFFRLYLFPFFHHCIFPIVFLHGFISMFFPISFLNHVSLLFLFQELYFFSCTIPRCFFPECFFQYWFFNVYFSRVVFCHFFLRTITSFFQYVFSRKRVFPVRYFFSRAVFDQLFPAPFFFQNCIFPFFLCTLRLSVFSRMFFPDLHFADFFLHRMLTFLSRMFFPELYFVHFFLHLVLISVFPECFSRIAFC